MMEVKIQVRHHALMLGAFTVSDIVRITEFNPDSVRTEVQRMKTAGLLTATPPSKERLKEGRREWTYHLVEDSRKRLDLSREIQSFLRAEPNPGTEDRPRSNHFFVARQVLDRALAAEEPERSRLASDAERSLRYAAIEDDIEDASPLRAAYLGFELARVEYVRGDVGSARERFEKLLNTFETLGVDEMAKRAEEHLVCLGPAAWNSSAPADDPKWRLQELVDAVRNLAFVTDSPLAASLLSAVKQLQSTGGALQIKEIVHRSAEQKLSFFYAKSFLGQRPPHVYENRGVYTTLADNPSHVDQSSMGAKNRARHVGGMSPEPARAGQ